MSGNNHKESISFCPQTYWWFRNSYNRKAHSLFKTYLAIRIVADNNAGFFDPKDVSVPASTLYSHLKHLMTDGFVKKDETTFGRWRMVGFRTIKKLINVKDNRRVVVAANLVKGDSDRLNAFLFTTLAGQWLGNRQIHKRKSFITSLPYKERQGAWAAYKREARLKRTNINPFRGQLAYSIMRDSFRMGSGSINKHIRVAEKEGWLKVERHKEITTVVNPLVLEQRNAEEKGHVHFSKRDKCFYLVNPSVIEVSVPIYRIHIKGKKVVNGAS